ncbi:MAG: hypothetical protein PHN73_07735, partial [Eubacteriales bacterium]|nr:hypothetical protein [Eubacteriales bacterium]
MNIFYWTASGWMERNSPRMPISSAPPIMVAARASTEGPTTTSNVTVGYPAVHVFGLRYMNAGEPFDFTKIGAAKPS